MTVRSAFDRSGFASLDDLETPRFRELLIRLEAEAAGFERKASAFRSAEYHWPADPLHQWSRVWEYPYVWHHLSRLLPAGQTRVMDLGSGVTFFPFALAARGARVTCVDMDPVVERDLAKAVHSLRPTPGTVHFLKTNGTLLDAPDSAFDAAYCISVLEHAPEPASLVPEVARVIKPGGLFLLTIDVAVEGRRGEIKPAQYLRLREAIGRDFEYVHPEDTVHPRRTIATDNSPYPVQGSSAKDLARRVVDAVARATLRVERGVKLWCHGFVLRRKVQCRYSGPENPRASS